MIEPFLEIHRNCGAVVKIYAGSLPEFPKWFEDELQKILGRLRKDAELLNARGNQGLPQCQDSFAAPAKSRSIRLTSA